MELEKLREILEDVLHIDKSRITEETSLIDDLCVDSLDLFQITVEIGKVFELEINMEEADRLETVGDLLEAICSSGRES